MQRRHLEEAKQRDAPVIDNGDFFCAMQGKFDKRSSKSKVRPEHQQDNYLDALVDTAADFFEPYAHQLAVIGDGNHETSIKKRHETDLGERLVAVLNSRTKAGIQKCGYGSWVRFMFVDNNASKSIKLYRYHGHGGGGPVTKGTIQTNRRAAVYDADIIYTGHIHEEWTLTTVRASVTNNGIPRQSRQTHICGPTYKDEYADGTGGWHVETGKPPKPIGAVWLRFRWKPDRHHNTGCVVFDTLSAR